ncbi:MAG: MmcQ/YjbR family DNA-binding protein [Bacteroidales bacterium]
MDIEQFRSYCLGKKGATESFPFDETTLVFKVGGKIFALTGLEQPFRISLKCDPEMAVGLREKYPAVIPGYHLNKKHWNTINIDGSVNDELLFSWIDHSYDLVYASLPAKVRRELEQN